MKGLKLLGLIGMTAGAMIAGAVCYLISAGKESGLDDFIKTEDEESD